MLTTPTSAAALAAFLGSFVEGVEALTIVLAVGTTRGWRASLAGAGLGLAALILALLLFGPALQRAPVDILQIVVGVALLLFGLRWLRKAMLRAAGVIALHDEAEEFAKETEEMRAAGAARGAFDAVAVAASFKAVVLEGLEVVLIVFGVGAGGAFAAAAAGAAAALVLVVALGFVLRHPLARVPENTLKFGVGVLLTSFGLFWLGEGMGVGWPGGDAALPVLALAFLAVGFAGAQAARLVSGLGGFGWRF